MIEGQYPQHYPICAAERDPDRIGGAHLAGIMNEGRFDREKNLRLVTENPHLRPNNAVVLATVPDATRVTKDRY